MMRLDHFVINVDPDLAPLQALQRQIAPLGYPFEPRRGKGTRGFKVADLWIGLQYLELVRLLRPDGGGWSAPWVAQYNRGHRGLIGLMLMTDALDTVRQALATRGITTPDPERVSFTALFGLLKKTMPWRLLYLPPIPGTDLQICFIEMDSREALEQMKPFMRPNAAERGITGIGTAIVRLAFTDDSWAFLRTVFPSAYTEGPRLTNMMDEQTVLIFERTEDAAMTVELRTVTARPEYVGGSFAIENVRIVTTEEHQVSGHSES